MMRLFEIRIPSPREIATVRAAFNRGHGHRLRLLRPRTFSEFIQRRKLFDGNRHYRIFCDKVRVREYVRECCGGDILIPLQWKGRTHAIPFDELCYPAILKPSHLSGHVCILRERPEAAAEAALRSKARQWLKMNHGLRMVEPGYARPIPRLLVEDLLQDESGGIPMDYKLYSFGGRVEMIQVHIDRFGEHRRALYDRRWRRLPFAWKQPPYEGSLPAPSTLPKMIAITETLTREFHFLRVDLYSVAGRIYLGEITVYPESGIEAMKPPIWDRYLGDVWRGRLRLEKLEECRPSSSLATENG